MSNSVGTNARFKNADYPANWFHGPFGCIVPYPRETLDLTSSLRPLSNQAPKTITKFSSSFLFNNWFPKYFQAWFFVIAATLTIVFYLEFTDRMNFRRNNSFNFKSAGRDVIGRRRVTDFVLGNLVSQGKNGSINHQNYHIHFLILKKFCRANILFNSTSSSHSSRSVVCWLFFPCTDLLQHVDISSHVWKSKAIGQHDSRTSQHSWNQFYS